jgi:hypothetical protein
MQFLKDQYKNLAKGVIWLFRQPLYMRASY